MYDLPYHKEPQAQVVKELVAKFPFAFLTGCDAQNEPVATQVPLFLEEKEGKIWLSGHIMKGTDHHKAFLHNPQVLAVFTTPHTYVSGTWYANPHTPSTWNYISVHFKGMIHFLADEALEEMLRKTSLHFENYNPESATIFDNLPPDFIKKVMPAIIAFEIEVTKMDNVFKLSQDRDRESYQNIQQKLKAQGEAGEFIAAEMQKRIESLFK
jgi:transcriptional regulator